MINSYVYNKKEPLLHWPFDLPAADPNIHSLFPGMIWKRYWNQKHIFFFKLSYLYLATALQISSSKRNFTVKNYNHLLNYASSFLFVSTCISSRSHIFLNTSGAWQYQYLGLCLSYFPLRNSGKHCWYIRKMNHKTGFCPILTLRACSARVSSELVSELHVRDQSSLVFQSIRVRWPQRVLESSSMSERHL